MSGSGGTAADAGEPKQQPKGWPKEALDTYDDIRMIAEENVKANKCLHNMRHANIARRPKEERQPSISTRH